MEHPDVLSLLAVFMSMVAQFPSPLSPLSPVSIALI